MLLVTLFAGSLGFFIRGITLKRSASTGREAVFGNDTAILKLVVKHAHDGLILQDITGRIEWINPAYTRITGYTAAEIIGRRPQEFILTPENQIPAEEIAKFKFDLSQVSNGSEEVIRNQRKNGEYFWNQLTFAVVEAEQERDTKVIIICRDVTSQVEHLKQIEDAQNRLKYQAEHDDLTGLANRSKLAEHLEGVLEAAQRGQASIGFLHIDLDHFKDVNDTFGHGAGDAVLVHVANLLDRIVDRKGIVARMGGDEFVAVLDHAPDRQSIEAAADTILEQIRLPISWEEHQLHIGCSIGLVSGADTSGTVSGIINSADLALYEAKANGRDQHFWYSRTLGEKHRQNRLNLELLDKALDDEGLRIVLLPQYCLNRQTVVGFEAAVRWDHPSLGEVDPLADLTAADDVSRTARLEDIALRKGIETLSTIQASSNQPYHISVNVSPASLRLKGFAERLHGLCHEAEVSADTVYLELNERLVRADELGSMLKVIEDLSGMGFRITLDGFGGGYGSAGQLRDFKANLLKISPDLIARLNAGTMEQHLVQSIIQLAKKLDLKVMAEGVDKPELLQALQTFDCPLVQGAVIGGALRPEMIESFLRQPVLLKTG
ncbi:hypothetical protein GCM10009077_12430 [Roseibium denhamense]|uniref:PAS domain S-box-containing protein/diguanylate cyclase (GGDEF) domain-containing protein n=2 Tax=Roseibium denhamense TaxID=76305 RepID=A0ABY1NGR2_9HYPH|nr:PAS domain S-box-containing protein/diguanylate cyclase (GGDEF) domain-containing protein [Roseibium denhamense]